MKFMLKNLTAKILTTILLALFVSAQTNEQTVLQAENKPGKPPMFVLQVGIGKYKSAKYPELKGARFDVEGMLKLLTSERFGVSADNIKTLLDGAATKEEIVKQFENHLIAKAKDYYEKNDRRRDAVVLFQFSGHGSQVPDTDKDEIDGKDETFVTVESEDAPGKNFDITDDEIYALTRRLNKYTDNIVFILDSCHSGSGTREGSDVRRIPARTSVPVPVSNVETRGADKKTETDNEQTDLLPPSKDYIVISAARADQLAGEMAVFENDESRYPTAYYGRLTFFLLNNLRNAGEKMTYRELMDAVSRDISAKFGNAQNPQIEGEDRRVVFGGLSKIEDNSIKISAVENKQIYIAAGAMQGLIKGTILDVFDKRGEKIGTAKISKTIADKSVADVVAAKRDFTTEDRAVIISQDLGALRLRVLLDGDDAAKLSADDRKTIQNLRKQFAPLAAGAAESHGVDLASGKWNDSKGRWDVALLKDRFDKVFPDKNLAAPIRIATDETGRNIYEKFPAGDRQIFYLAGNDFVPLYGFYVEADKDYTERTIEKALLQLARLRSVKSIANDKSTLKGAIKITPYKFDLLEDATCDEKGNFIPRSKTAAVWNAAKTAYKFSTGDYFWLEVANTSDRNLYITLLNIGTDGSVQILFPRNIDGENINNESGGFVLAAKTGKRIILGEKCDDGVLRIGFPTGRETFKIIATTEPAPRKKFEFLEMESLNAQRGEKTSLLSVGDWTTAEINFEITARKE